MARLYQKVERWNALVEVLKDEVDLVDDYVRVTDKDSMQMTRRLAREEGMFLGGSCGMAMAGALQWMEAHRDELTVDDLVVVIMPDGGYRSLGKVYNDIWMQDHGFLDATDALSAEALVEAWRGG